MEYIKGITDCAPEEVGYDSARIDMLVNFLDDCIKSNKISASSFCVSRKGSYNFV